MTSSFSNLHPLLQRNLRAMGYRTERPVQAQAITPLLDGRDVIALAATGTGKTAAFIAPMAHRLLESPPQRVPGKPVRPETRLRALVLCPTRELAQQVAREAAHICQGTVLRTLCAYGKVGIKPQKDALARGIDLLIATPGRVRELLDAHAMHLSHIRYVAIDEADRMLDMGFLPQVNSILQQVPRPRQISLFTATMPDEVASLAAGMLNDPLKVEVDPHTTPAKHVQQHLLEVHERDKVALVLHLLGHGHDAGVLIFCRTRRRVGWVGTALQRHGIACGMIHGDRSQAQRQRALDRFTDGDLRVVVATDVAARGLHIPATRTVINYDLPIAAEEYVHRIGRAGHGGGFGEAFTLLAPYERDVWKNHSNVVGIRLSPEQVHGFTPSVPLGVKPLGKAPEPKKPQRVSQPRPSRGRSGTKGGGGVRKPRS